MRLEGRVAIVTGAARGIGQELSVALAREGARIAAADVLPCTDTLARVSATSEAMEIETDIADASSVRAMLDMTIERFGRVDVLINNAALLPRLTPFDQFSEDEWDRVMAVNVKGTWQCCKAVVPVMRQAGKGKIINVSSDTIWSGAPMLLPYVTSKGAIVALTRSLARELSGTGINVNAITPGFTITAGTQAIGDPAVIDEVRTRALARQIVKRSPEPSDLTGAVLFLASDDSDFVTGQTINVNGGATHH